jgi:hypothetical protein
MSWVAMNAQLLSRSQSCWANSGSLVGLRATRPLCQRHRFASTQSKARPAAATAPAPAVTPVKKSKISTKTSTVATPKTRVKKTTEATPTPADASPVTTPKKTTRSASTKAATPKTPVVKKEKKFEAPKATKAATDKAVAAKSTPISDLSTPSPTTTTKGQQTSRPSDIAAGVAGETGQTDIGHQANPGVATAPRPSALNAAAGQHPTKIPRLKGQPEDEPPKRPRHTMGDWMKRLIALPIFIVTSYYLYDRRE